METNRRVAQAGLALAAVTVACRLASLGKEAFVAGVFGAGPATDAYALDLLVPAFAMALLINAARRAFLANYPRCAAVGRAAGDQLGRQFFWGLLLLAALGAAAAAGALPPLWPRLIWGRDAAVERQAVAALPMAVGLIPAAAAVAGLTALLNARGRFAAPQWTALIPTTAVVLAAWLAGPAGGARSLLAGLLAGTALQTLVLAVLAWRAGAPLGWRVPFAPPAGRRLWGFAAALVLLDVVTQANTYVDRTMASMLEPGKVAVLHWAALLKDFFSSALAAPLLLVLLPHFAGQVARGERDELNRSASLLIRYAAVLLFPVSAILFVCCPPLLANVRLGRLDPVAARALGLCLAAYGAGLFADLASSGVHQALVALGKLRLLAVLAVLANFFPNLVFNAALIRPWGEVGLAFSTALVGYLTLAVNCLALRRETGWRESAEGLRVVLGALAASVLSGGAGWLTLRLVPRMSAVGGWLGPIAAAAIILAAYAALMLGLPGCREARQAIRLIVQEIRSRTGV